MTLARHEVLKSKERAFACLSDSAYPNRVKVIASVAKRKELARYCAAANYTHMVLPNQVEDTGARNTFSIVLLLGQRPLH